MSITASLMEGASGGSSLPLPSGHLDEPLLLESSAPRAGLPCPSPAPSPLAEHSWAFPQDWGGRAPVQAAQCPGALLLGTAEQRRPPGVGDLGVPLARSVACFALLLVRTWHCPSWPRGHQWGSSRPGGGLPGCRPTGLPREEAGGSAGRGPRLGGRYLSPSSPQSVQVCHFPALFSVVFWVL